MLKESTEPAAVHLRARPDVSRLAIAVMLYGYALNR
jgi:hypothetical protein